MSHTKNRHRPPTKTLHDRSWCGELFFILSGQPAPQRRRILLQQACDLLEGKRVAALLWLWDAGWNALALNAYHSNVTDDATPTELVGLMAFPSADTSGRCPQDPEQFQISISQQPALRAWAEEHGFASHERLWPVRSRVETEAQTIAFLQLLSSDPIAGRSVADADVLCRSIAILISQSRTNRKLQAVDRMLNLHTVAGQQGVDRTVASWLHVATDALFEITKATAAIVFRNTNEGFKGIVIRSDRIPVTPLISSRLSIVNRVGERQQTVRLRDFDMASTRIDAFGTERHDMALHAIMQKELLGDRVRSVLLAPIVFQEHTLAVIALVNKRPEHHLARVFSQTDEEVLRTVAGFLAGILPSTEMYEAVGRMASLVSLSTFGEPQQLNEIFAVLTDMIPGTTGAALIRRRGGDAVSRVETIGGLLSVTDVSTLTRTLEKVQQITTTPTRPGCFFITLPVASLSNSKLCWLTVELNRPQITPYERQFLSFVCKELSHVVASEQGLAKVVEQFAQLRHGIRSGLTGVIGYVHEALGCFELYRELGYTPSELSRSRFRKSLERANLAAAKTQNLLEESRFLLGQITPAALRVSKHSISKAVRTVLNTLRPDADERDLNIGFDDRLHNTSAEDALFDRALIEMLLFNVFDNAIKYSYRKRPLNVTIDRIKESWRVRVTNYGVAIREEDKDEIFKPFTRRASENADSRPGTGLGLAVADEIARAHSGKITCKSVSADRCAETTFVITIPRFALGRS